MFNQVIYLYALVKMDNRYFLLDPNLDTQLLKRLTDRALFGCLSFIHTTTGENEIIHPCTMTFD